MQDENSKTENTYIIQPLHTTTAKFKWVGLYSCFLESIKSLQLVRIVSVNRKSYVQDSGRETENTCRSLPGKSARNSIGYAHVFPFEELGDAMANIARSTRSLKLNIGDRHLEFSTPICIRGRLICIII